MKQWIGILAALTLATALTAPALAESTVMDGWSVRFTADNRMEQDFGADNENRSINRLNDALDDELRGMQPGDDVTFRLALKNENEETTSWYMTNEVLHSLEDSYETVHGGAYTYTLTYAGPGGETTFFNSETVGGTQVVTDREGLNEATSALEDFFYLDTLRTGETGYITLRVALDGETQGNSYQDTLADLKMNFAVELGGVGTGVNTPNEVVKTGDDWDLVPYYIAMGVSGALFLALAADGVRRRKKEGAA